MPATKEPKLVRVNVTVPQELLERVEQFAQERLEDRSTAIRQLIMAGWKAMIAPQVIRQYERGVLTQRQAAARLGVDIWELRELLAQHGIPASGGSPPQPDFERLRRNARALIRKDERRERANPSG